MAEEVVVARPLTPKQQKEAEAAAAEIKEVTKTLKQVVDLEKARAKEERQFRLEAEAVIYSELKDSKSEVLKEVAIGNEAVVTHLISQVTKDMEGLAAFRGIENVESANMIQTMVQGIVDSVDNQEDLIEKTKKFFEESDTGQKIVEGYQKSSDIIKGHMGDILGETGQWMKDTISVVKGAGKILSAPFAMFGKKDPIDAETLKANKLAAKSTALLADEATKKGSLYVHVVNLAISEAALLSIRESMYKQAAGTLMLQARMTHMATKMEAFNKVMGGWAAWFQDDDTAESLLTEIRDLMVMQMKEEFRDELDARETPMSAMKEFLFNIVGLIGFALGGLLGPILLPFITIFKALTGIPGVKGIGKLVTKVGAFFSKIPILGKFISSFAKGLKFLGIPFTIFLGVIDFIKGFVTTEGDLVDKITGGVKAAIKGFFDLPIKVIGWVVDKITGFLFGEAAVGKGAADTMFKFIEGVIDFIVDFIRNPFEMILNGLKHFGNFFISLWNMYVGGIQELLTGALGDFIGGKAAGLLEGLKIDEMEVTKKGKPDEVGVATKQNEQERARQEKEKNEKADKAIDANKEIQKTLGGLAVGQSEQTQTLAQYYSAGGATDQVEEPPDVIESIGIFVKNLGLT